MKTIRTIILGIALVSYGQAWSETEQKLRKKVEEMTEQEVDQVLENFHEEYITELTQSAENGDVAAEAELCKSYFGQAEMEVATQGQGNYDKAIKWCKTAANHNDGRSQNLLGFMYKNGVGVPQHYGESLKWYIKSAEQGYAMAQRNLGEMYENGIRVKQDYVHAHMWYNLSRISGVNRDELAKKMTAADVAEAQRLAMEWVEKHP